MTTSEKVAYLKGLAEGMGLKDEGEGKLFRAIFDILSDLSEDLDDVWDEIADVEDGLDAVSDDLEELEEDFYDLDPIPPMDGEDYWADEDTAFYSVECPGCGYSLTVDEETLAEDELECPECGEVIDLGKAKIEEVSFDDLEEEPEDEE